MKVPVAKSRKKKAPAKAGGKPSAKPKPQAASAKGGRPSTYTLKVGNEICEWIARGGSLKAYCRGLKAPAPSTVLRWLREPSNEEFRIQYARAREEQADAFVDEIVDIADNDADMERARIKIDVRKWAAVRLAPKKYGDRVESIHKGHDGGPIKTEDVTPRRPDDDRLNEILSRYGVGPAAAANGHAHGVAQ